MPRPHQPSALRIPPYQEHADNSCKRSGLYFLVSSRVLDEDMRGLQLAPQNLRLNHVAHFNSERKKIPVQVVSTLSPKSHHLEHSEPRNSKTCQDGKEHDAGQKKTRETYDTDSHFPWLGQNIMATLQTDNASLSLWMHRLSKSALEKIPNVTPNLTLLCGRKTSRV